MRKITLIILLLFKISGFSQFSESQIIDSNINSNILEIIGLDRDGDNLKDIIAGQYSGQINWYKNTGQGNFNSPQVIPSSVVRPRFFDKADVDSNQIEDLLITDNNGNNSKIAVIKFPSNTETIIDSNIPIACVRSFFVDFDADSDMDIVACCDLMITLYLNDGFGNFGQRNIISSGEEYYNMTVGNFNNDNYTDLAILSSNGTEVYYNNTALGLNSPILIDADLHSFIQSADLNNDNYADVFVKANNSLTCDTYLNSNNGVFTLFENQSYFSGETQYDPVQFSKLNNDNYFDIVYADETHKLAWRSNNGSGHLNNKSILEANKFIRNVYCFDIDNDGDNDIIWYGIDTANNNQRQLGLINNTTFLNTISFSNHTSKLYPNPAHDFIVIENGKKSIDYIEIINSNGQIIKTANEIKLNVSDLSCGFYFVKIFFEGNTEIKKWVKN